MSVDTSWGLKINTNETLSADVDAATAPVVTHTGFSTNGTMSATSTPPATLVSYETITLSSGATIDLTALTGTNGITVDGSSPAEQRVQLFKVKNTGTNAMTFTEGAATGYLLLGSGWKIILLAGQEALVQLNDAAPEITSSLKHIDVAGTDAETFELSVVIG